MSENHTEPANPTYSAKINLNWGRLTPTIKWCEQNCKNTWSYKIVEFPGSVAGTYAFSFLEFKDYSMFKLKFT